MRFYTRNTTESRDHPAGRSGLIRCRRHQFRWVAALVLAAAHNDNPEVVRALIAIRCPVNVANEAGFTPLIHAAGRESGGPEMIKVLLAAGADAGARDSEGKTALDHARENPKVKDSDAYWKLHDARSESSSCSGLVKPDNQRSWAALRCSRACHQMGKQSGAQLAAGLTAHALMIPKNSVGSGACCPSGTQDSPPSRA